MTAEKPTSEKYWNELSPERNDHFFRLCDERAIRYSNQAFSTSLEFAKYLFAANAGAAAGLFLLSKSDGKLYLVAFFLFCAGVFFVGVAFFTGASASRDIALGWARDVGSLARNEFNFGELDRRNRQMAESWKWKVSRLGLVISFVLLMAGGIAAGYAVWKTGPPNKVVTAAPISAPLNTPSKAR